MTEVDAVLPEGIAASTTMPNKTSIDEQQQQKAAAIKTTNNAATTVAATAAPAAATELSAKTKASDDALLQLKLKNLDNDNENENSNNNENSNCSSSSHHNNSNDEESSNDVKNQRHGDTNTLDADGAVGGGVVDSEEDDSQITTSSSADNKTETPTTATTSSNTGGEEDEQTNGDHAEDDEEDDTTEVDSTSVTPLSHNRENDGQLKSVDDDSQPTETDSEQSAPAPEKMLVDDEAEEDESQQSTAKSSSDSDVEADAEAETTTEKETANKRVSKVESQQSETNGPVPSADHAASNGKGETTQKIDAEEDVMDITETEPAAPAPTVLAADKQKANGISNISSSSSNSKSETKTKPCADDSGGIVNLDDSDEEMMEAPPTQKTQQNDVAVDPIAAKSPATVPALAPVATPKTAPVKTLNESDDAVIIGSDSEPESNEPPAAITLKKIIPTPATVRAPPAPIVDDDDDDDDCVVIEDDTPAPVIDTTKRKLNDMNDELPPHKRQRSVTPAISAGIGVGGLTIKDARSLMPQDAIAASMKKDGGAGVYPVTITSASPTVVNSIQSGPPKLVPMSNNVINNNTAAANALAAATLSFAGLPSMTNNANLLPGLTDDMFVLEAPSFIVPYIYEKPPAENIRDVVKAIEAKYALSPEDLAEADKSDEFDMMTEQNKEDKPTQEGAAAAAAADKKKKKGDDNDDSWSEQSDEDDDEDEEDSDSGVRTKVLIKEASDDLAALKGAIKPAAALAQSGAAANTNTKPGQENYFESPLGKFFMDIGVGLVQEYVQADLLRLQKRKMRKSLSRDPKDFEMAINALSGNLQASKTKNAPYKFTLKRCEFCNFKSESALAMANHYETPHMNGVLYKCNFCTFEIRNATEIVYHMEAVHNIKARLIKPLPYHQCPNCGFEDNGKAKLARHQPVCAKKFRPELNLAPPNDWEAPAKIPRIKPRHGLVGTATAYQAMAAQAAAQKAALASIQAQQAQAAQARSMQAAALAAQNAAKLRARAPIQTAPKPVQNTPAILRGPAPVRNPVSTNVVLPNNYHLAAGQILQQANKKPMTGQPSISITPLPRQNTAASGTSPSSSKVPPAGMKPGQSPSVGNSKAQFVICEICDGYIKDLEQLRNHMQWMHKVKIHPKMIYNRPPLNCQKCQFRFFTDQGLERHLLGSHGLVTSSMQEAANKGKDAGRCPVCGRMYQWKLLNHVSRDHHMTLKPAHLSYKCTVCTATFGMYKQFETHVYTAHSTVAKKAMETKKNQQMAGNMGGGGGPSGSTGRNNLGTNEALLKPLKINDEITIIPQPASKPRITNMESHVID